VSAGQRVFASKPCAGCHGANGQGGVGPKIAGLSLSYAEFSAVVRAGAPPMPAFTPAQVSDAELQQIYAYLRSLQ